MPKRMLAHRTLLTLSQFALALALATSCRCEDGGASAEVTPSLWQLVEPFQTEDRSLTVEAYQAIGLAPYDRNWGVTDMKESAAQLQTLSQNDPALLPRYKSARSGALFERITSRDNLDALRDPALPISIRFPATAEYASALDSIVRLYLARLSDKSMSGSDVVELYGAQLRACLLVMERLEEFLPTLSVSDPSYPTRTAALDRIRAGLGEILTGIVRAISEPRFYGYPARMKLVGYCIETFDAIVPRLTLTARESLLDQLTTASTNRDLANLQPQLNTLRDRVAYVVSSTKGIPAKR